MKIAERTGIAGDVAGGAGRTGAHLGAGVGARRGRVHPDTRRRGQVLVLAGAAGSGRLRGSGRPASRHLAQVHHVSGMLAAVEIPQAVLDQVSSELQAYVYMLVDPESGIPFYVGKGHRLRHADHVAEAVVPVDEADEERSRKLAKIDEIRARGLDPEVWILRYELKSAEYTAVEAAAIDLLMSFPLRPIGEGEVRLPLWCREQLTNARRESAHGHGVTLLQTLIDDYAAPPLTTSRPLLLITLNGWQDFPDGEVIAGGRVRYFAGWKPEWLVSSVRREAYDEIGESVSAWWSVSPQVVADGGIEHVAAVHRGVTRALFKIEPGSWETITYRVAKNGRPITKSAFWFQTISSGPLFDEVIGPHGRRVPRAQGAQNSINYWPHHPYVAASQPPLGHKPGL
jgi:uncharacterized protein